MTLVPSSRGMIARVAAVFAAWIHRRGRSRRLRRTEAHLREFSKHVRRDIGLDR